MLPESDASGINEAVRAVAAMSGRTRLDLNRWRSVLRRDPCVWCGKRGKRGSIVIDHIVPWSSLGFGRTPNGSRKRKRATFDNAAPVCVDCGQAKANTSLLLFLARDLPCRIPRSTSRRPLITERTPGLRRNATRLLGACPGIEWWSDLAERVRARTLRAESYRMLPDSETARWVVPVASSDGMEFDLLVDARAYWLHGEIWRVLFTDVQMNSMGEEVACG